MWRKSHARDSPVAVKSLYDLSVEDQHSCASPKFYRAVKSTASSNFLKPDSAITAYHVPAHLTLLRSHRSPSVPSTKSAAGEPRPQTTSVGVEKKEPPTQADKIRSVLLDRSQSTLVGVEKFPAVGQTRNRRGVASSSVSHLWATAIESRRGRKKADLGRAPADHIKV